LELRAAINNATGDPHYDLHDFDRRTGPLVDELASAVREMLVWHSDDGHGQLDGPTQVVADRLAALDRESARSLDR
jgi:hypothetical protein